MAFENKDITAQFALPLSWNYKLNNSEVIYRFDKSENSSWFSLLECPANFNFDLFINELKIKEKK
ncbi:MAG: hypothetical protein JEY94_08780 [Melioribacteraceae bacterium]|nr:hypothetical protein [Melioribacteraceae bacterium]